MTRTHWLLIALFSFLVCVAFVCLVSAFVIVALAPKQSPQAVGEPTIIEPTGASVGVGLTPAKLPSAAPALTQIPRPTTTDAGLSYGEITTKARQLTEIKRNDYYKSLIGKNVHWSGKVADVTDSGEVHIRIADEFSYYVVLQGIPKETSASLNLNDVVSFKGTISDVSDLFGSGSPIITLKPASIIGQ